MVLAVEQAAAQYVELAIDLGSEIHTKNNQGVPIGAIARRKNYNDIVKGREAALALCRVEILIFRLIISWTLCLQRKLKIYTFS